MSKQKPAKRNKKGNVVLDRETYTGMMNRDKDSGSVQFLDPKTIDPRMFSVMDVTRDNVMDAEGLSSADRAKIMNYFDQTPISSSAQYVIGKPNDLRPEQSAVSFIANPQYADYSEFVEDAPEPVERMGMKNMIRPNYAAIQPVDVSRESESIAPEPNYNPKKRMIKPQGFRYGSNKPAKGSITRRKRPKY